MLKIVGKMAYENRDIAEELKDVRRIAFLGVTIASIATLVCVVSVPIVYSYAQQIQTVMQNEVDFCKSRSSSIWKEVTRTQVKIASEITDTFD